MKKETSRQSRIYSRSFKERLSYDMKQNGSLYLMIIPVIAFFVIFCYVPMYGAIIAFKNFTPAKGIMGSPWVGLANFKDFFTSFYFLRVLKNTLVISITGLIFSFPASIIFALLINEIRVKWFAKTVQTITYMPYFISLVVLCGLINEFTSADGLINDIVAFFGGTRVTMLSKPAYFVPIYIISGIWQSVGWNSIIYLAAIAGINQELYEGAYLDGAGRFRQTISITIPGIMPTIVIMFVLALGGILTVGYEKIILLYSPVTYETADVISTFVYRKGLQDMQFSYSTAVGLFNSTVTFIFVVAANAVCRKVNDVSLW